MPDLAITHYRFRLVRRGWARGPAGARVVAAARGRLPAAIAERLAEAWPEHAGDPTEPVHLKLRVQLRDLADACGSDEALRALIARLIAHDDDIRVRSDGSSSQAPSRALSRLESAVTGVGVDESIPCVSARPVSDVLLAWHARGELSGHLEAFTDVTLERWHDALLREIEVPGDREDLMEPRISEVVAAHRTVGEVTRTTALRGRIHATVDVIVRFPDRRLGAVLTRALDAELPLRLSHVGGGRSSSAVDLPATRSNQWPPPHSVRDSHPRRRQLRDGERSISSVLPFLLLRPLQRIGYLEALASAFLAAGKVDQLGAFATALAYKVLLPLERGWRRAPRAVEDAAVFAGLTEPVPESALTALAEDVETFALPLDTLIGRAVLAGHSPAHPLLVVAHDGDHLLVEPDGLFPIAWNDAIDRMLVGCRAPVIVTATAAARLPELAALGVRLLTDAPPLRTERWTRFARGALWTNDTGIAASAAGALDFVDDAQLLVSELMLRRAAVFDRRGTLDRSLALAAGAALGDIAHTLWRDRGPTSPLFALRRFADLSGVLRYRDGAVELALPLGARSIELTHARLLGSLKVPWLGELLLRGR